MDADPDVIVIGGGPSGLMAALAASQGTPFWSAAPERLGRVLVLEEHKRPGGIAAYGTLSITNAWVVKGGQLKAMLLQQARHLPIEIRCSAPVTDVRREGDRHAVVTPSGTHRAKAVVLACGIFSHLAHLRYRNTYFLAETLPGQRELARSAERAAADLPEDGRRLLLVGSHPAVSDTADRFRSFAPALALESLVDSRHDGTSGRLARRLAERRAPEDPRVARSAPALSAVPWNAGDAGDHPDFLAVVFDYNTYKLRPENAVRALGGSGVSTRDGYVPTDAWGRTNVPGIWACGNAIFPFSGILQALYTGFVAGIGARSATDLAEFDRTNGFLPWLAVPNDAWAGWLEPLRETAG
jgi:thioredoxin reductase